MIKGCTLEGETACWKEKLSNELNTIRERYHGLEKELSLNNQLLEESKVRYNNLETEFHHLTEERDTLCKMVSESSQKLALITDQKENVLKDLNTEFQRRKDLQEKIKQFSVAFARRKTSLVSLHSEFKSKIEEMRAENPVSAPKSFGCQEFQHN